MTRHTTFKLTIVLTMLLLGLSFGFGRNEIQAANEPIVTDHGGPTDPDVIYVNGELVEIAVALDQVGVAVLSETRLDLVENLLRELYDIQEILVLGDMLWPFPKRDPSGSPDEDRKALREFMRQVEQDLAERQIVVETGYAAYFPGDMFTPVLMPNVMVVKYSEQLSESDIEQINDENGVMLLNQLLSEPNLYQVAMLPEHEVEFDILPLSVQFEEHEKIDYAHPDYYQVEAPNFIPNDTLFGNQWHLLNSGQGGGQVDADADVDLAWDFTTGADDVVIAVFDDGIQLNHPDIQPNLWTNTGETPGNGVDDDGNGFVDDINGWDFGGNDNNPGAGAGDFHGTAVAGVAAARGNNAQGVSGACPNCEIMALRRTFGGFSESAKASAFTYAQANGADIMNNSWGHTSPAGTVSTVVTNAINNAAANGLLIIFSGGNQNSAGWCNSSYTSINNSVMAISSSTNFDTKAVGGVFLGSAIGNCIDLLAPSSHGDTAPANALGIATTDRTTATGYNSGVGICAPWQADFANRDYTDCFGGTSSAAPLAAGAAGLVKAADPSLDRTEIQRLLQDTTDRIEDSVANYNINTGFDGQAGPTHSYGRLNAHEAVRIATPRSEGGKGNADLFLRDNRLDWGNTTGYDAGGQGSGVLFESPRGTIGWWRSASIKIDAPPYQPAPATPAQFDAFLDEQPIAGETNRVYVMVRNRGTETIENVTVKLHWTQFGGALPPLPGDFWTNFPADSANTTQIHPIGVKTIELLPYSGASVAGTVADAAQIAAFDFEAPMLGGGPNHYCLFAVADSAEDPIDLESENRFQIDSITPNDNNITHKNVSLKPGKLDWLIQDFVVRNPFDWPIDFTIDLDDFGLGQRGWKFEWDGWEPGKPLTFEPYEEKVFEMAFLPSEAMPEGQLSIAQNLIENGERRVPMGGLEIIVGDFEQQPVGDVTCDDTFNIIDALFIARFSVGGIGDDEKPAKLNDCDDGPDENTFYLAACDASGDLGCNIVDALFIAQCGVGLSNQFCPEPESSSKTAQTNKSAERTLMATSDIALPEISIPSGGSADMPIQINTHGDMMGAAQFTISYDSSKFTATGCALLSGIAGACNTSTPGTVLVNGFSLFGTSGVFDFASITFESLDPAGGTAAAMLAVDVYTDTGGSALSHAVTDGSICNIACEPTAVAVKAISANSAENQTALWLPALLGTLFVTSATAYHRQRSES